MTTFLFSAPGTYTIEDDGIRGNGISVIRGPDGNIIFPIAHPSDEINFIAQVPGVNFVFDVLDSFGTANVNVGSLTDAASNPDSIVVKQLRSDAFITLASNGSISEGGADSAADIVAAGLVMSAGTGIATAGNALETQITFIEAETGTGGINIVNSGAVQIGGLTAEVRGLDVGTSGDLNFTTTGFMVLADTTGTSSVHGGDISGNVTLTALGADSDIFSSINRKMVSAAGGGITLVAGRDILAGTGGNNFDNDLLATNFVTIRAGRDFVLDGTSNVRTGAFGGVVGGDIDIQAGRNINLSNATGGLQTIEAFNGNVILTTGPGGAFIENASFPAAVQTTHDIFLNADAVVMISGGLNTVGIGWITIRPVTPGRAIDLGTTLDSPGVLGLSDSELDRMFTLNLDIGDANSGPLEVSAALTPFIVSDMVLRSGTEILVRAPITLPGSLVLHAGNDLFFTAAGSFTSSGGAFTGFVDEAQNDGDGGTGALGGAITGASSISLFGNLDSDILTGTAGADMIEGLGGNDVLSGLGGNDVLNGGAGVDSMSGGLGDDRFFIDNAGDLVAESAGQGDDRALASVSWTLTAGAHVEMLTTTDNAGTASISLTGNALAQYIYGNAGSNQLDGGGGGDVMTGFGGDDFFIARHTSDRAVEAAGQGADRVFAAVNFTLEAGSHVEMLTTIDNFSTAAISLTGNELAQYLYGNAGSNQLDGRGGGDVMTGFEGGDFYVIRAFGDRAVEAAGGGTDRVFAAVSFTSEVGSEVELLSTIDNMATTAIDLTGNEFAQYLYGNAGANILDGRGGADVMTGFGGADGFAFTSALGGGNVDRIGDFSSVDDTIRLDDAVFAGLAPGVLAAGAFVVGTQAGDSDDRIIYNLATGALLFDADGSGGGAAVHFATLDGVPFLAASDFLVI